MNSDERLAWLIDGHLRGELSAEEKAELAEMLDTSAAAQRRFVELAEFETVLTEAQGEPCEPLSLEKLERARLLRMGLWTAPWLITAVCLLVVFWPKTKLPTAEPTQESPDFLALLVDRADARSSSHDFQRGAELERGTYNLESGLIHLRFQNGADLLVEGPAQFEIIDGSHAHLEFGTIRAIVPPPASGFSVKTANTNFKDVGTEFGLRVDRDSGAETLFVFEGRVDVYHPYFNELADIVRGGQVWRSSAAAAENPIDPESFPSPATVGHRRWLGSREPRLESPGLIAFYDFERTANQPTLLRNLVEGTSVSDAQIHGARWVSGRWPGKDALLFDGDTDFAELEVAGEFEELTIAAWVFVNRLDHPLNAVFDSNGWESGDIHLQIQRSGVAYSDLAYADQGLAVELATKRRFESLNRIPPGAWTHIAATFSRKQKMTKVFVNGVQSFEWPLDPTAEIRPGTCRIGNWLAAGEFAPVRSLNGRIDELALWNRALTEPEIQTEVNQALPVRRGSN